MSELAIFIFGYVGLLYMLMSLIYLKGMLDNPTDVEWKKRTWYGRSKFVIGASPGLLALAVGRGFILVIGHVHDVLPATYREDIDE